MTGCIVIIHFWSLVSDNGLQLNLGRQLGELFWVGRSAT